jgi:hypothetical protein
MVGHGIPPFSVFSSVNAGFDVSFSLIILKSPRVFCRNESAAWENFEEKKLQFVGERQGSALHPLKGLLKKSLKNPQNF